VRDVCCIYLRAVKCCIHVNSILPSTTAIISASMRIGTVPGAFKSASVRPHLTKISLDATDINKITDLYPIFDLIIGSMSYKLLEPMHSAYKTGCSTESQKQL
jgi:hypothetical protein